MIWYNETLTVPQLPPGASVSLTGLYQDSNPLQPSITIRLNLQGSPEETLLQIDLYTHNPRSLHPSEPPLKEDVLAKYGHKIAHFRNKLIGMSFDAMRRIKS